MEEDVRAHMEVAVHERSQGGMACCYNWSEADHMLAELADEVRWIRLVCCWSQ
jgi:hypothetical protein